MFKSITSAAKTKENGESSRHRLKSVQNTVQEVTRFKPDMQQESQRVFCPIVTGASDQTMRHSNLHGNASSSMNVALTMFNDKLLMIDAFGYRYKNLVRCN